MLTTIFRVLCITGAVIMVGYWIYKYHSNQDVTLLEYIPIENVVNLIYPIPTICFVRPFIKSELWEETNSTTFYRDYMEFLKGNGYYERYKNIAYDQVTPNLTDYFNSLTILWKPEKNITQKHYTERYCTNLNDCTFLKIKNNYNGFSSKAYDSFLKCYSIEIDLKDANEINQYYLSFESTLETVLNQVGEVILELIHPNQFLRPRVDPDSIWHESTNTSSGELFQMASIEILSRRNKYNMGCLTNWKDYDDWVLKKFIRKVGCRPPYIKDNDETLLCNTKEQIKEAYFDGLKFGKNLLDPCKEMPFINYKHELLRREGVAMTKDYLISISYPPMAKMITQSQAVDAHSLVGNIGGYIGLFLGCAIIQLPELISFLRDFVKTRYVKNTWFQIHFSVEGNHKKGSKSNKTKINNEANNRNERSDMSISPITMKYVSGTNLGVEDKLRLILERMDRLELKWDLKFESLKYNH